MTDHMINKTRRIEHPAETYRQTPDVVRDENLSLDEKKQALDTWEQDARQLVTASNEGMAGDEEGLSKDENHKLDEVVDAKRQVGEKPLRKPAH